MAKITEKEIKDYILNNQAFKSSSVSTVAVNEDYLVYSYTTLIYRKSDNYFNNNKLSATTSKIQNIIIDCFGFNNGIKKRDK